MTKIIGARSSSEVGLAENREGVAFKCGTCEWLGGGRCQNPNPKLDGREVEPEYCCNLYSHPRMRIII